MPEPVNFRGIATGPVCEDSDPTVTAHLARAGAEFFIVPTARRSRLENFPTRIELALASTRDQSRAGVLPPDWRTEAVSMGVVRPQSSGISLARWPGWKNDRADAMDALQYGWDVQPGQ